MLSSRSLQVRSLCYARRTLKKMARNFHIDSAVSKEALQLDEDNKKILTLSHSLDSKKINDAIGRSFHKYVKHTTEIEQEIVTSKVVSNTRKGTEFVRTHFKAGELKLAEFNKVHKFVMPYGGSVRHEEVGTFYGGKFYRYPPASVVPKLMKQFILFVNSKEHHFILQAAIVKLIFLSIHPYVDGNGRTSRMIFTGLLRKEKFPYVTIPVTEEEEYYHGLRQFSQNGNNNYYFNYILKCIRRSLNDFKSDSRLSS